MQFIQGPDFPTGGLVFGSKDMQHAYGSGQGGVVSRGVAEIVEHKAGNFTIVIHSIPFRVNKADLIVRLPNWYERKKWKA